MTHLVKRMIALCLVAITMISVVPINAYAAGDNSLAITSYTLTNAAGTQLSSVSKGQQVNLKLTFKDTGIKTSQISSENDIDVTKLVGSFSSGTISTNITSSGNAPLEFTVTLSNITYSGSGHSLRMMVGYPSVSTEYETVEIAIPETVEYAKPTEPTTIPAPIVLISRSDISQPIEAGGSLTLSVSFKNLSSATIKSPVASFSPSDSIIILNNSSSVLSDIASGQTASVSLTIRAADVVNSSSQSLDAVLKFNYDNGSGNTQGSISEKIPIPTKAKSKENIPQPMVIISRNATSKPISAGQQFSLTFTFKNAGKTPVLAPVASFSTSDGLALVSNASSFELGTIYQGTSANITLNFIAASIITSATQTVNIDLKYGYNSGDNIITQVITTDKINIPANTNSMDASVPNLIICDFDYGGKPIAAGAKFDLNFKIKNTSSQIKVENVVASVESNENFAMNGSTNTFFYKSIEAGGEQLQKIPLQAMTTAKTGAQAINVSFKYEYVDKNKRMSSTASIKLSVPIYQPDRFVINAPILPEKATVGEELNIPLTYVNKGKGEASNVEASIVGDVPTVAKTQNLGNFEPGKSGTIAFVITPDKPGKIEFMLKVSYENANQEVKTVEFPVTLTVLEPAPALAKEMPEETPSSSNRIWIILIAALLCGGIILLIIRKKKKTSNKTNATALDSFDEGYLSTIEDPEQPLSQTRSEE